MRSLVNSSVGFDLRDSCETVEIPACMKFSQAGDVYLDTPFLGRYLLRYHLKDRAAVYV